MSPSGKPSLLERWVVGLPLLAGVATAFAACCLAGHALARVNCLRNFNRFHTAINHEALYYPTVSQVRSLARETLRPDQVAVVVGGNSVLFGYGQGAADVWTKHLQARLGDGFCVLNLALPGATPFEFGALAAEVVARDHPRLTLLTNAWPNPLAPAGDPDGGALGRSLYWQAEVRGLLLDNPERAARLHELEGTRGEPFRELRRQCRLDAGLGFHDLWNVFAYRCAATVWSPRTPSWTRPRRDYPDPDVRLPPAYEPALEAFGQGVLATLRGTADLNRQLLASAGRSPPSALPASVRAALAPGLRGRTLVLLNHRCPYYLTRLSAEERELYARAFPLTARMYARAGVRAEEVGRGLSARHYVDGNHLTAAGGKLLAREVAPLVRALAEELGYTRRGN